MYWFEGVGLSGVQLSISELSVVGGWVVVGGGGAQTHFMVGPGRGPTKTCQTKTSLKHAPKACKMLVSMSMSILIYPPSFSSCRDSS